MKDAMFEVPYGQDPYSAIGRYIRENITTIEDIIAVIDINGVETNELFMVDMEEDGFFIWKSDWYEGEKKVVLIDFFPVSEAINSSTQPDVLDTNVGDLISRQAAIDEIRKCRFVVDAIEKIRGLPSAQPQRKVARWEILYPNHTYKYHCSECGANHKYMFDFCPSCGADMRGEENG